MVLLPFSCYLTFFARFLSSFAKYPFRRFRFLGLTCLIKCMYSMAYHISLSIISYIYPSGMCSCWYLVFCLISFWNNLSVWCSDKVAMWWFSSASLAKNASRALSVYAVRTHVPVITSLAFSGLIKFGDLWCCLCCRLHYFAVISGVYLFPCCIYITVVHALGALVLMILVSNPRAEPFRDVNSVGLSSTEF